MEKKRSGQQAELQGGHEVMEHYRARVSEGRKISKKRGRRRGRSIEGERERDRERERERDLMLSQGNRPVVHMKSYMPCLHVVAETHLGRDTPWQRHALLTCGGGDTTWTS